jgi:hypothetical protein
MSRAGLGKTHARGRIVFGSAALVWASAVAIGLWLLYGYSMTPGAAARAPERWPDASGVTRAAEGYTLVLVAHPRCPCTRATLGELARLMTKLEGRLVARVLFVEPAGAAAGFGKTDLVESARRIPGVDVLVDRGGVEAAHFGAKTSGQVMLYSSRGNLEFRGGITGARAHEGDNAGSQRISAIVTSGGAERDESAVYGCEIDDGPVRTLLASLGSALTGWTREETR